VDRSDARIKLVARRFANGERWAFTLGVAAVTLVALYVRAFGLDPKSLWLDDQWVGIIVRRMTFPEFFTLRPPTPIGFIVVQKVVARLSSDPEWPLQLFPLACSLAQIVLIAVLVHAVTGRRSLGVLASVLTVIGPFEGEFAVRVKQYAVDGLATVGLLLAAVPLLERWSRRRAMRLVAVAATAALVSFPSLLVSVPLLHVALGAELLRGEQHQPGGRHALAIVLSFDLAILILYATLLHGQSHAAMREFWRNNFLPWHLTDAPGFLGNQGWIAIRGALPKALAPAVVLVPVGLVDLAREPRRRSLAVAILAFYAGVLAVSALRIYPMGGGRMDSFSHPVAVMLMMSGLRGLTSGPRLARVVPVLIGGLALALLVGFARPSVYPECDDAPVIRVAEEIVQSGDALIIYPRGALGVGYYAKWPIRVVPWADYPHGLHVVVERADTLTLPPRAEYAARPAVIEPDLLAFLAVPRARIFYFAGCGVQSPAHWMILRRLREHGYGVPRELGTPTTHLLLFDKLSL
jgi:hypothetical protein